ncbi:MAG: serine protease [Pseudomonadota bacterium]|nr:serine protease [Pseudomonadota bacterium]
MKPLQLIALSCFLGACSPQSIEQPDDTAALQTDTKSYWLGGQEFIDIEGKSYKIRNPHRDAMERWNSGDRQKIINGAAATLGQFPWIVSIGYSWPANAHGAHFCGGSILDEYTILTAAHCVKKPKARDLSVTAGQILLDTHSPRIQVEKVVIHENFVVPEYGSDIALLKLKSPLEFSETIQPMPALEDQYPGSEDPAFERGFWVMGWGQTETSGNQDDSEILQYLSDVPHANRQICQRALSRGEDVSEDMICAGFSSGRKDTCQGDSGGPLVYFDDQNRPTQIGIVSWGEDCAQQLKFGVYARIASFSKWISENR